MSEISVKRRGDRVKITGEMTIYHSAQLKTELGAIFLRNANMDLDLSDVSELDSAGFQVLALFRRDAIAQGKLFRLTKCSPPVSAVLKMFQVDWSGHNTDSVAATAANRNAEVI